MWLRKKSAEQFFESLRGAGVRRVLDVRLNNISQREFFDGACLLCSEATPEHCHRRMLAEYLGEQWREIRIVHL